MTDREKKGPFIGYSKRPLSTPPEELGTYS